MLHKARSPFANCRHRHPLNKNERHGRLVPCGGSPGLQQGTAEITVVHTIAYLHLSGKLQKSILHGYTALWTDAIVSNSTIDVAGIQESNVLYNASAASLGLTVDIGSLNGKGRNGFFPPFPPHVSLHLVAHVVTGRLLVDGNPQKNRCIRAFWRWLY